jgi:hypothetical protein
MKRSCAQLLEGITALAHGEENAAASAHVVECSDCRRYLAQLQKAVQGLQSRFEDAPMATIALAKAVFPRVEPLRARLVTSTLGLSGARGGEAFQAVYEFEGGTARVMYKPEQNGWQVLGRVEGEGWESEPAELDDMGRFEFSVSNISDAEIRLTKSGSEVVIDAPEASTSLG